MLGTGLGLIFLSMGCQPALDNQEPTRNASLLLPDSALPDYERDIDHAGLLSALDDEALERGKKIYGSTCFNCHGNPDQPGSLPESRPFWTSSFKYGKEPYQLYQTLTHGYGLMPPQTRLVPRQKYDVIHYIRENFLREKNPEQFFEVTPAYLAGLPSGSSRGPEPEEWAPWKDMDYGNFLIYTYELVDEGAPPRNISGGRSPLPNEDYADANFAQKGIAVRLDKGEGGIAAGRAWMIFDHDLMRVAGGWTGEGFIDWRAILLNGEHNIYPRIVGDLRFENPVGPGWADPRTGSFDDPRFLGLDGRPFGPLPREWAHYKGLDYYQGKVIVNYTVGDASVREMFGVEYPGGDTLFTRTLNIEPGEGRLILRMAPDTVPVAVVGAGVRQYVEDGFHLLEVLSKDAVNIKILIGGKNAEELTAFAKTTAPAEDLTLYRKGGPAHYPTRLQSPITPGKDTAAYVVDVLQLPLTSPWKNRFMLSGIDFIPGTDQALVCTVGGDVWKIDGITQTSGNLSWQRIASGLFQPLGIKWHEGAIYVSCRDQIAILRDLNGDGETDHYESFNSDHQVTEHFHEFAMGLQTDSEGNFYYAKSGRHARTALVPQHGTLLRVSADGSRTEIIANGFRAANGVCINPDGTFIVTDQEGYWNPMNRINWVKEGGFYGNMYGYGVPADSSDAAMEEPLVWVDKAYDRSPAELLWVDSDAWGPLNGSLLSLSYGYGKVYVVPHEEVGGQMQGGIVELPIPPFATGVMRGRFHPGDGQLYACGLSAWATNQVLQEGGLYRVRYSGKEADLPVGLHVVEDGLRLTFSDPLDPGAATQPNNFQVKTWALKRTRNYGSDRYDLKSLGIASSTLAPDNKTLHLVIPEIEPEWIMEVGYRLRSATGKEVEGTLQLSIHQLGKAEDLQ